MTNCPFCTNEIAHRVIYTADESYVILSRDAINPGQALVIPKRDVATILELTQFEVISMYTLAKKVADILVKELDYDGVNILMNSGEAAGQTIHHAHIHIVPRTIGDVPSAREWLNPAFVEREYTPNHKEIQRLSLIISQRLNMQ